MPVCPECENELNEDFGIVDCSSCGTVCFVNLEGDVQVQGEVAPREENKPSDLEEQEVEEFQQNDEPLETEGYIEESTEEHEEALVSEEDEPEPEHETIYESETETEVEVGESLAEEPFTEEFSDEEVVPPTPMSSKDFFKDLEIFSEESSSEEFDHIYYDVLIKGAETSEEKSNLVETVCDSRLDLFEEQVKEMFSVEGLAIKKVSLLRLTVLHKRLLDLNVEVVWTLSEDQTPSVPFVEEEEEEFQAEDYQEDEYE